MDDPRVLPGAIVVAGLLVAIGLWLGGNAVGEGLRCQAVSNLSSEESARGVPLGDGATRPAGC